MTNAGEIISAGTEISTHTLTWSVTTYYLLKIDYVIISTHTLTWSVTSCNVATFNIRQYFNSHAHVERDQLGIWFSNAESISTHTLTWSVTDVDNYVRKLIDISTHTLTWSVTKFITCSSMVSGISTHTLTWSVTFKEGFRLAYIRFQLTRSRGA